MEKKKSQVWEVKVEGIDPSTGEVLPFKRFYTEALYVIPYRKKIKSGRWFLMFQDFLKQLAKDEDLTGTDFRVLHFLFSELDWENWVQVPQRVIAKELNIDRTRVTRSLKKLQEKRIIQVVRDGRSNRYRIHPELVWKGKYKDRDEALDNVIPLKK